MIFIIFTLVNISLILIKIKEPTPHGIKTYPMAIPVIAIVLNITLLGFQITSGF